MLQRNSLKSAILVIFLSGSGLQAQTSKGTDLWGPFQFLIGNWSGVGSGNPADAIAGSTSFSFDLDKCIILRRNRAEYPPIAGEKINKVHEDLMIIYPDSADSKFHAVYFDNEGHFINYIVSISANQPALEFVLA